MASVVWPMIFSTRSAISCGGFVGEGDGEDGVGRDAALLNEIRDAMRDDAGLAGAGAGEQKHRAVDGFDGFALLRIQFVE